MISNWTAAPVGNYVHVETADLYRPNARFTTETQGYQVLTPFGKLGYSQFFYNLNVNGDPDFDDVPDVPITIELAWPFVTQGARPIHVYDSVTLETTEACPTRFLPGNETQTPATFTLRDSEGTVIRWETNEVTLEDYGVSTPGEGYDTEPLVEGFQPATVTVEFLVDIPDTGFAYINHHLDDGLKGKFVYVNGDGDPERYDRGGVDGLDGVNPTDMNDTWMPNLFNHELCMTTGEDPEKCSDPVQNVNDFKKNPGVAGMVVTGLTVEDGGPIGGLVVELRRYSDGMLVGQGRTGELGLDTTDAEAWYQIVFKHTGKAAMYEVTLKHPTGDVTIPVELKGNAFSEVNFVEIDVPPLGVEKVWTSNADGDGSGTVSLDDSLTYTITATNLGTANLTNVVVSDDLITPTGGGTTPCGLVAPGGTCTLVGTYVVTQADVDAGNIHNIGTADSDEMTLPVIDVEDVPVAQNPALSVDKPAPVHNDLDGGGDVSVGDTLTYTITATNTGDMTLTNVAVSDDLTGDSTSCPTVAPGGTCVLLDASYTVTKRDVRRGSITNTGTAGSDQTPDATEDEVVAVP